MSCAGSWNDVGRKRADGHTAAGGDTHRVQQTPCLSTLSVHTVRLQGLE